MVTNEYFTKKDPYEDRTNGRVCTDSLCTNDIPTNTSQAPMSVVLRMNERRIIESRHNSIVWVLRGIMNLEFIEQRAAGKVCRRREMLTTVISN